ncbi:MAG: hypothetical protein PHO10_00385 [Gemmiger sp.]|nr:hypothetical protein [Gemmiger sp.]
MERQLLRSWCDGLLRYQIAGTGNPRLDGGILCPACMRVHGRSGDAVLPLITQWATSGAVRYLHAAERLFAWSETMLRPDGSYNNDTNSNWNGITVFAANQLGEILLHFGTRLPPADYAAFSHRFAVSANYLLQNIEQIGGNINYPVTCAYTMALAARLLPDKAEAFAAKGRALAAVALAHLTQDGLLYGEGHPTEAVTPKGCRPVDIGYNVEESLPALALYAELAGDAKVLAATLAAARAHLQFMLPDGGWNNSFGSRSYKWSYWGSRTSDGCAAGFAVLAKHDPLFGEAILRNLALLGRCTQDGLLYGGPHFAAAGEPPCIHHTICHAKGLAALVLQGWQPPEHRLALPAENAAGAQYFPTIDTWLLAAGGWQATVTGYDYQYLAGGHPTGGALSLLWNRQWGPVLFGGMDPYRQNEPNNMQMPRYQFGICPTPRLVHKGCCSSNDVTARLTAGEEPAGADPAGEKRTGGEAYTVWAEATGTLYRSEDRSEGQNAGQSDAPQTAGTYHLRYTAGAAGGFTLTARAAEPGAVLLLPIVSPTGDAFTLTEGKATFRRGKLTLCACATGGNFALPAEYRLPGGHPRRLFSPVGGLQAVVLELALPPVPEAAVTVTFTISAGE